MVRILFPLMFWIPPMSNIEANYRDHALYFWTERLDMTLDELLEFLADNGLELDELWATLKK